MSESMVKVRWVFIIAAMLAAAPAIGNAAYVTLDSANDTLNAGDPLGDENTGNVVNQSGGSGTAADPYVYSFVGLGDGLELNGFKLFTNDGASFNLNMGGYGLSGDSGVTAIDTYRGAGNSLHSGYVTISNVGNISLGTIDTRSSGGSGTTARSNAGYVTIGSQAAPAGTVRIDAILANAGSRQPATPATGLGGNVTIYGSGDVLIQNEAGTVRGDIRTDQWSAFTAGHINVQHNGSFRANDLLSYAVNTWSSGGSAPGNITLNGNLGGDLEVRNIEAGVREDSSGITTATNAVTIQNYTAVHITGNVNMACLENHAATYKSGDLNIFNILGNLTIDGTVSLNHVDDAKDGQLKLAAGGNITLASLDLGLVSLAEFQPGGFDSRIVGDLLGFDTSSSGGAGTLANPWVTTQTEVRILPGAVVWYDDTDPENAYLNGEFYYTADIASNPGQGGVLAPLSAQTVPEPATLGLLALGGLAMTARTLRRRRS